MFANYHYFLVFAEECNVSRAAERLYTSHQNLSKYLAKLEKELGVSLFERKPTVSLTYEGKLLSETLRQVETLEQDLHTRFDELRGKKGGEIRFGTTEGRFRILMPDILSEYKKEFPDVRLQIVSASSPDLQNMLLSNQLDLVVFAKPTRSSHFISYTEVLRERLYLVVSDNMLREYFGKDYPACKERMKHGCDLREFQKMPFALNMPAFNSSLMLKEHLRSINAELNCVHESSHPDLHHMMSARDYAASFCLTMYLPELYDLTGENGASLNVFPISGLTQTNPVVIGHLQSRVFPEHTKAFVKLLRRQCRQFERYDLPDPSE